eukprot:COSAG06_NODE_57208_length_281_cov_0.835165_1_plen_51_part_01
MHQAELHERLECSRAHGTGGGTSGAMEGLVSKRIGTEDLYRILCLRKMFCA